MFDEEECCGTCRFAKYSTRSREWICQNVESDRYGLETVYSDPECDGYEQR